jgi:hypothetical protein
LTPRLSQEPADPDPAVHVTNLTTALFRGHRDWLATSLKAPGMKTFVAIVKVTDAENEAPQGPIYLR